MEFGLFDVFKILGALGFFIYGMKVMSEGLQQVAGGSMRKVLGAMTSNRFTGVFTGFLITGILQSSSATTVMTVSFVNAGLLSLVESAGVMMGANIGTTITGWIVSVIGFEVKIANYALPLIAIAFPMMFVRNTNSKKWAEVLIGFALLFLGLAALKDSVPDIKNNPEVLNFLYEFKEGGFPTRLMFVGVGTLLTVVVQSSSAAMTLTIVLTTQGLPLDIAAAMVLGENIGTTITAELASLVANTTAKRSARIHSLFNIIGVTWMIIFMPYILDLLATVFPPPSDRDANKFALAAFHTTFNAMNVLLLIGFLPALVNLAIRTVKANEDEEEEEEEFKLEYLGNRVLTSVEMSLTEARAEIEKFGKVVYKMSKILSDLSAADKPKKKTRLREKLQKFEDLTDKMEEQIATFLVRLSEERFSPDESADVKGMIDIITDLERMGDIMVRLGRNIERMDKKELVFNEYQKNNLNDMAAKVDDALKVMINNLARERKDITLQEAKVKEEEINKLRKILRRDQMKRLGEPGYEVQTGIVYRDIYFGYERLGDHIINVTESIVGEKISSKQPSPK